LLTSVSGTLFKQYKLGNYSLKKSNSSISNALNAQDFIKSLMPINKYLRAWYRPLYTLLSLVVCASYGFSSVIFIFKIPLIRYDELVINMLAQLDPTRRAKS